MPDAPEHFVPAVGLEDLEQATPLRAELVDPSSGDKVPVCLVRLGDEVRAIHDTCSHQEWSLAQGLVYGNTVECDLHGSCFDLETGRPTSLPAMRPVPTYAVRVDDGRVLVDVSTALNGAPTPEH